MEFKPSELCKKCGGVCCKNTPGPYTPEDVVRIFGSVAGAVRSGIVAIDWWEGDPDRYFMRPRQKNAADELYHASWGGECIHLTDSGCKLPREEMPHFCKRLEPGEDRCVQHVGNFRNSKDMAADLWEKSGFNLRGI